jgi:hypothetical protein
MYVATTSNNNSWYSPGSAKLGGRSSSHLLNFSSRLSSP